MKKTIIFICVIAVTITLSSCKKRMYFACCDKGHAHWEGIKYDSGDNVEIRVEEDNHDRSVHGGVPTATRCYN